MFKIHKVLKHNKQLLHKGSLIIYGLGRVAGHGGRGGCKILVASRGEATNFGLTSTGNVRLYQLFYLSSRGEGF